MTGAVQASDYPHLFGDAHWGALRCRFELCNSAPATAKTSNVNVVPYAGNTWLLLKLASGEWEVPGGTLEPDKGRSGRSVQAGSPGEKPGGQGLPSAPLKPLRRDVGAS